MHKFQQTHDGLLQSYQNRGKRNCCVTIPEKFEHLEMFYFTFHSLILLPVCPFPFIWTRNHPPTTTIWTLIKHHKTPNVQMILCSVLLWLLYKRMFNLILNHKTPCISVFSNFSHRKLSHAVLALSGKQTFPRSQRSDPLSAAATQTVALRSSRLLSFQQSGGQSSLAAAFLTLAKPAAALLSAAD